MSKDRQLFISSHRIKRKCLLFRCGIIAAGEDFRQSQEAETGHGGCVSA